LISKYEGFDLGLLCISIAPVFYSFLQLELPINLKPSHFFIIRPQKTSRAYPNSMTLIKINYKNLTAEVSFDIDATDDPAICFFKIHFNNYKYHIIYLRI